MAAKKAVQKGFKMADKTFCTAAAQCALRRLRLRIISVITTYTWR